MLRDITIGQHFPGNSLVHRFDPRLKLVLTILYIVLLFAASNPLGLALSLVFLAVMYAVAKINLLIRHQRKRVASAILCGISGLGEAQQAFLKLDLKNLIQKLRGGTNSPCLLRLQTRKFLCRKITARFKLNLKTDGLDCKMIFKFWKNVERFHSTRKQCRRIYICLFCFAKYLLGTPKPLNCIPWMQAVLSK